MCETRLESFFEELQLALNFVGVGMLVYLREGRMSLGVTMLEEETWLWLVEILLEEGVT